MITNKEIDRLTTVEVVRDFAMRNAMAVKLCEHKGEHSLLIFRTPYFVAIRDVLVENYLEITLSDLTSNLLITGSCALACSLELGLQDLEVLRSQTFNSDRSHELFLSFHLQKFDDLHTFLGAIDKLLSCIATGGLLALRAGRFNLGLECSQSIGPMYPGLREEYLRCVLE